MSLTVTNSSKVVNARSVTSGTRVEGSNPFTSSRALSTITDSKDFQANFTLTPPSRGSSSVVTADRSVRV